MTEPTDPFRRPESAPLPAPMDPFGQHPSYHPGYSEPAHGQPSYGQPAYGEPAAQVPQAYAPVPYGYPTHDSATGLPLSDKSRVAAGVLSIVLGAFGAGRFYTRHVGVAIAQIAVTWLTCGLGHIWPLIDGIIVLAQGGTDSEGRVLRS